MRRTVVGTLIAGALAVGLLLASGGTAAQGTDGVTLRLEPADATIQEDDNATVALVATGLDRGLERFNVTVVSSDVDRAYARWATTDYGSSTRTSYRNFDRAQQLIRTSGVEADVEGEVTLARFDILGDEPGAVDLAIDAPTLTGDDGTAYDVVEATGAAIDVEMDRPGARVKLGQSDTVDPYDAVVAADQRVYYDLWFDDLDGGLANVTYEVTIDDPSAATVENVTSPGSPASLNVTTSDAGRVTTVDVDGANLTDEDGPTVGSVAVLAGSTGTTDLSVDVLNATNATGDSYRITATQGSRFETVPRGASADVDVVPSDEQPAQGASFDVVASGLDDGLREFELHLHSLGDSTPDYEELPNVDEHRGGAHIAPREGSLRIQVREIPESVEGEVTLLRVTLDEAAGTGAVDPVVRPIYLLDRDRRAYHVGYEPLRETGAVSDGSSESGSNGGSGADGGAADGGSGGGVLPVAVGLLAVGLAVALVVGRARR